MSEKVHENGNCSSKSSMIGPLANLYYYYAMMKLAKVDSVTHRGASRGSVWLS